MYSLGVITKKLTSPSRSAKDTSAIAEMKLDIQRLIQAEHDAKKKEAALISNPAETDTSRDIAQDFLSQNQSSTARELPLFPTMNAMVNIGTGSRGLDSVPNQAAVPRDMPAPNSAPEDTVLEYLNKCAEAAARLTADIEEAIGKWNGSREYQPGCLSPAFQITTNAMDRLWTYENRHVSATAPPPPYAPLGSTSRRLRSAIYHARVPEQEWDELPRRVHTTVKRHQVPESSTLWPVETHVRTEKIIIRREHSDDLGLPLQTARERSVVGDRWNQSPPNQLSPRSSPRVREFRFECERDYSPPPMRYPEQYEIERYGKETEYFSTPAQIPEPSTEPVVIRRDRQRYSPQPIIIREERRDAGFSTNRRKRREPQYEFIERTWPENETLSDNNGSKQSKNVPLASIGPTTHYADDEREYERDYVPKRSESLPVASNEDYFYERRVIERDRSRKRYRSKSREQIRPKDIASGYNSDDSFEYVRRERAFSDDVQAPYHKPLAGVALAEILRPHRKAEREDGGAQLESTVGDTPYGGEGVQGQPPARSRSSSDDSQRGRYRKRWSRLRSRSESTSVSRTQHGPSLAGTAAIAAVAARAKRKSDRNGNDGKLDDRECRTCRIAQAEIGTVAAEHHWERARSRSRERSKSRVRQAVPIAGAGLGSAALAGLWEKNKADKAVDRDGMLEKQEGIGRRQEGIDETGQLESADDAGEEQEQIKTSGPSVPPSRESVYLPHYLPPPPPRIHDSEGVEARLPVLSIPPPPPSIAPTRGGRWAHASWTHQMQAAQSSSTPKDSEVYDPTAYVEHMQLPPLPPYNQPLTSATYIPDVESYGPGLNIPALEAHNVNNENVQQALDITNGDVNSHTMSSEEQMMFDLAPPKSAVRRLNPTAQRRATLPPPPLRTPPLMRLGTQSRWEDMISVQPDDETAFVSYGAREEEDALPWADSSKLQAVDSGRASKEEIVTVDELLGQWTTLNI